MRRRGRSRQRQHRWPALVGNERTLDLPGSAFWVAGGEPLSVRTDPEGVAVQVTRVDDGGSVWTQGATLVQGLTPVSPRTISAARLRLRFEAPDGLTARLPLQAAAGTTQVVEIHLPPSAAVPPGFVYVPGGRFVAGADDLAPGATPPREVEVAGLCMARHGIDS